MQGLREQRQFLVEKLIKSAGVDPLEDRMHVGYIQFLDDVLNLEFIESEEESKDD